MRNEIGVCLSGPFGAFIKKGLRSVVTAAAQRNHNIKSVEAELIENSVKERWQLTRTKGIKRQRWKNDRR